MAGVKGRSGPPGNLNAARNGYHSWRRRRALPPERSHVNAIVAADERDLIQDKGGADVATAVERALIRDAGMAYGLILLALEEARERGCIVVDPKTQAWDLMPGLQRVRGLLDTRRMNLLALGVERREQLVDPFHAEMVRQEQEAAGNGREDA